MYAKWKKDILMSSLALALFILVSAFCLIYGSSDPWKAQAQPIPEVTARVFETSPAFTPGEWMNLTPQEIAQLAQNLRTRILQSRAAGNNVKEGRGFGR